MGEEEEDSPATDSEIVEADCVQALFQDATSQNESLAAELNRQRAELAFLRNERELLSAFVHASNSKHVLTEKLDKRRESLAAMSIQREALRLSLEWLKA